MDTRSMNKLGFVRIPGNHLGSIIFRRDQIMICNRETAFCRPWQAWDGERWLRGKGGKVRSFSAPELAAEAAIEAWGDR